MILKKASPQKLILRLALSVSLLLILINPEQSAAQSIDSNNSNTITKKVMFNPPPIEDNGAPGGRRKGAGSHSLCEISEREEEISPLIALMPTTAIKRGTKDKVYVWGNTISAHPTFWFYVAYPVNSYVEFTLQDEAENEIYQTTFQLDKTPGIIGLNLSQDKVSLEAGETYHWYFNIMCNPENSTDDFVEGWVERVVLNPVSQNRLELAQPLEKISIYAENGLWYDTLSTVDRLRQQESENKKLSNIWTDLLQQVGLEEISQEPVVKRYDLAN